MPQPRSGPEPGVPVRGSDTGRPIMALLDLLGQRWTLRILYELASGDAVTFRDLQQRCDGVSSSVLNRRLKALRAAEAVEATPAGYRLTIEGRRMNEFFPAMEAWASRWAIR